jgi:hypothetical protein
MSFFTRWFHCAEVPAAMRHPLVREMPHTWYVTFELQRRGVLSRRRRSPRATRTFATEAEAKNFAREKFDEGLVVFAGTINPQFPKQLVPSSRILDWLETAPTEGAPPDKQT